MTGEENLRQETEAEILADHASVHTNIKDLFARVHREIDTAETVTCKFCGAQVDLWNEDRQHNQGCAYANTLKSIDAFVNQLEKHIDTPTQYEPRGRSV